jgi:hypothetical protein
MYPDTVAMKTIEVMEDVVAIELKGDTAEFNAKAFKTNPNASAEDLVRKMPGIQVENGTVTAQGEQVRRVLVDGRRFFGDDPAGTLKTVPAEMVDKVQVYDAQTDESRYSGYDDGTKEKTMNLKIKEDKKAGQFGKYYGGYGSDERFAGGLAHNYFDGPQRLTVLGITNNINQQNFAIEDMLSSMGMTGRMGSGMLGWARMAGAGNMLRQSGSRLANLYVDGKGGVTTTHSIGTNTSLEFAENVELDGSYLFNYGDNTNSTLLDRQYVQPPDQSYTQRSGDDAITRNHRLNLRFEAELDSSNRLMVGPSVTYQDNTGTNVSNGLTVNAGDPLSSTNTTNGSASQVAQVSTYVHYSHTFKPGRTFSVHGDVDWNDANSDGSLLSENSFRGLDSTFVVDQVSRQMQDGISTSASFSMTEQFREHDQLRIRYRPSYRTTLADKRTTSFDSLTGDYTNVDPLLSNTYDNTWLTHNPEISYRMELGDLRVSATAGYQWSTLTGIQSFPIDQTITRNFNNFLPSAEVRYKFSMASDLRLNYNTFISAPSVSQLQNVVDNSNPIQLSIGNADLVQTYTHNVSMNFRDVNWMGGKMMFGFGSVSYTQDFIGTESIITSTDTIVGGVRVPAGAQITRPVNLQGRWNANSFLTYGFPVKFISSNLNINGGVNYSRTPGMVNGIENFANNTLLRAGFYLSTNASEDFDLSVNYGGNYNIVINSLQKEQDQNYFFHTAGARLIWNIGAIACSTDVNNTLYTGLGPEFDRVFTVWNVGIGYRFFEDRRAELRVTVFDILGQNDAVSRTVNDISIENTTNNVITRYGMLTFSYDLRAFTGGGPTPRFGRGRGMD